LFCSTVFMKCETFYVSSAQLIQLAVAKFNAPALQLFPHGLPPAVGFALPATPCASTCARLTGACSGELTQLSKLLSPTTPEVFSVNCNAPNPNGDASPNLLYAPGNTTYRVQVAVPVPNNALGSVTVEVHTSCFRVEDRPAIPLIDTTAALKTAVNINKQIGICEDPASLHQVSVDRDFKVLCEPYVDYPFFLAANFTTEQLVNYVDPMPDFRGMIFLASECREPLLGFICTTIFQPCGSYKLNVPAYGGDQPEFYFPSSASNAMCRQPLESCKPYITKEQIELLAAGCSLRAESGELLYPETSTKVSFVPFPAPISVHVAAYVPVFDKVYKDTAPPDCPMVFSYGQEERACTFIPGCPYEDLLSYDVWNKFRIAGIVLYMIIAVVTPPYVVVLFTAERYRKFPNNLVFPGFLLSWVAAIAFLVGFYSGIDYYCDDNTFETMSSPCGAMGVLIHWSSHFGGILVCGITTKIFLFLARRDLPLTLNGPYDAYIYYAIMISVSLIFVIVDVSKGWVDYAWPNLSCAPLPNSDTAFYMYVTFPFWLFIGYTVTMFMSILIFIYRVKFRSGSKLIDEESLRLVGLAACTTTGMVLANVAALTGKLDGNRFENDAIAYYQCLVENWLVRGQYTIQHGVLNTDPSYEWCSIEPISTAFLVLLHVALFSAWLILILIYSLPVWRCLNALISGERLSTGGTTTAASSH